MNNRGRSFTHLRFSRQAERKFQDVQSNISRGKSSLLHHPRFPTSRQFKEVKVKPANTPRSRLLFFILFVGIFSAVLNSGSDCSPLQRTEACVWGGEIKRRRREKRSGEFPVNSDLLTISTLHICCETHAALFHLSHLSRKKTLSLCSHLFLSQNRNTLFPVKHSASPSAQIKSNLTYLSRPLRPDSTPPQWHPLLV